MREISLLLEEDEIFLMRAQARMFQVMSIEENDLIDSYMAKVLQATESLGQDWRKEIGKMQRAMRRIRATPLFAELQIKLADLQKALVEEMQKEEQNNNGGGGNNIQPGN